MTRKQRRGRQEDVLRIFYEIGRALARGHGYDTVVRSVVRAGTRLTGADAGSVLVLDPASGNLIHREGHGLSGAERTISFQPGEGVAGWVAQRGRAACIADIRRDPRFVRKTAQRRSIRSLLCVPVKLEGKVVGVLTVTSSRPRAFDAGDARLLGMLAAQVALDLENARLEALASRDPLTGIANRRRFDELLERLLVDAHRTRTPLSIALMDLDHFKTVNDVYGHPEGDRVLRMSVERWQGAVRAVDVLARLGGEEFAVVIPAADAARAKEVAERLRLRLVQKPFPVRRGTVQLPITVSIGVAVSARGAGTPASLLSRADSALYRAKREGRNRVVVSGGVRKSAAPRKERRKSDRRRGERRKAWPRAS